MADYVRYEDFGAVGDGRTDDFAALRKAHEYANANGMAVKADPTKTYYLGPSLQPIVIMTDTDWGRAKFVVDDREVDPEHRSIEIIEVRSNYEPIELDVSRVPSISKWQQKLDVELPRNCLMVAKNTGLKQFRRKGANRSDGFDQVDCFIIDKSGSVLTPIIWDFEQVTSLSAYPIDERVVYINGGEFTTIATGHYKEDGYTYFGRGIDIGRSNVVFTGLTHHITGEGERGSPYGGFAHIRKCVKVSFRDCHFTGHKTYQTIGVAGTPVSMGTYDINMHTAIDISFYNCHQDDILNTSLWGIIGSNCCKNLLLDGCTFSRIDAHMNAANMTVRNSILGHHGCNAIGHGNLILENVTIFGPAVVNLRGDYGSSWDGDIFIKNVTLYPQGRAMEKPCVIGSSNSGEHEFGYVCRMPRKIVIENLKVMDAQQPGLPLEPVSIFGGPRNNELVTNYDEPAQDEAPFRFCETLIVNGVVTQSGKGVRLWAGPVDLCFAARPYSMSGDAFRPNFRADICDVDRFTYDPIIEGDAASHAMPAGKYRLLPEVRVSHCPAVALSKSKRPARVVLEDSAVPE